MRTVPTAVIVVLTVSLSGQTKSANAIPDAAPRVCARCIRAHEEFLASDALRGRGSGTEDERKAATYIASELQRYGVAPAGDAGRYLQQATITRRQPTGPPQLKFHHPGDGVPEMDVAWTHGKEILVLQMAGPSISGPLQKIDRSEGGQDVKRGAMVFLQPKEGEDLRGDIEGMLQAGAAAVLFAETPAFREQWTSRGKHLPDLPAQVLGGDEVRLGEAGGIVVVNHEAEHMLKSMPDGVTIHLEIPTTSPSQITHTWNVMGVLRGRDPALQHQALLLSAHLDHLGVGAPVNGDSIYNGADDDASGVTAVLELARALGKGPAPRRTVIFALFGSEELGGLGSAYFLQHPPVPLKDIAINLEFEMIGRRDAAVPDDTLWLTGWDRSTVGPELAAHGARLVADPHPKQHFFERSDNYLLAKKGVVAQTISSYGLHGDYHQPSDDLAHLNFQHMTAAIGSLLGPIEWLVNSDFTPKWVKPVEGNQ